MDRLLIYGGLAIFILAMIVIGIARSHMKEIEREDDKIGEGYEQE